VYKNIEQQGLGEGTTNILVCGTQLYRIYPRFLCVELSMTWLVKATL
jgi:hypothetical protein